MEVNIYVNRVNWANSEVITSEWAQFCAPRTTVNKEPSLDRALKDCYLGLWSISARCLLPVTLSATSSAFEIHSLVDIFLPSFRPPLHFSGAAKCPTFSGRIAQIPGHEWHDTSEVKWTSTTQSSRSKVDVLQRNKQRHSALHRPSNYISTVLLTWVVLNILNYIKIELVLLNNHYLAQNIF